jgi:hypothetical protein
MFSSPLLRSINFHRSVVSRCYTERIFSPAFIHYFGHILLTGCPIDDILFPLHSYLQADISTLLVGVFITFLQGFGFGV